MTVGEVVTGPFEEENKAEMIKYAEIPNAHSTSKIYL
jgi:hypothetical protein